MRRLAALAVLALAACGGEPEAPEPVPEAQGDVVTSGYAEIGVGSGGMVGGGGFRMKQGNFTLGLDL